MNHVPTPENDAASGKNRRVVIIGAGIAGLATATLLARNGYEVTVLERLDTWGGRAGELHTLQAPGFRWDAGPSWYLMPEAFDHFFALCGTSTQEQLDLVTLQPAYRVFTGVQDKDHCQDQHPRHFDVSPHNVVELFESMEKGAGGKLQKYLAQAETVYRISLEHFLYSNFSRPHNLIAWPLLRRVRLLIRLLRHSLQDYVAREFKDFRLRQVLTYPAVFLSTQPATAPALYSLMSVTDLVQGPQYPRGGFVAVTNALYNLAVAHGVRFHFHAEATAIETEPQAASGKMRSRCRRRERVVGVRWASLSSAALGEESVSFTPADVVVSAADLQHTEMVLLPAHLRTYSHKHWRNADPGISTVLIYAGVKGELPELAHHTLIFSKQWEEDFAAVFPSTNQPDAHKLAGTSWSRSIYISKTSATDDDVAPDGYENLFVLIPVPADAHFGHGSAYNDHGADRAVQEVAEAAVEHIAKSTGIRDLRRRIVVMETVGPSDFAQRYHAFAGGAIGPAHTLRQSAFFRGSNKSAKVDGLYFAGATTVPGVGVPLCLISAENVLKRLVGAHSNQPIQSTPEN
ncbi:MAG: phytoene desaturase family protein [Corynebacterium sp.]|nr:phytoene desaturase family protein [Corynebacterium sp.]